MCKLLTTLAAIALCSGCAVSYHHLSDPRTGDDGYDLVCADVEREFDNLRLRGGVCRNLASYGGEYVLISATYSIWEP